MILFWQFKLRNRPNGGWHWNSTKITLQLDRVTFVSMCPAHGSQFWTVRAISLLSSCVCSVVPTRMTDGGIINSKNRYKWEKLKKEKKSVCFLLRFFLLLCLCTTFRQPFSLTHVWVWFETGIKIAQWCFFTQQRLRGRVQKWRCFSISELLIHHLHSNLVCIRYLWWKRQVLF